MVVSLVLFILGQTVCTVLLSGVVALAMMKIYLLPWLTCVCFVFFFSIQSLAFISLTPFADLALA